MCRSPSTMSARTPYRTVACPLKNPVEKQHSFLGGLTMVFLWVWVQQQYEPLQAPFF